MLVFVSGKRLDFKSPTLLLGVGVAREEGVA